MPRYLSLHTVPAEFIEREQLELLAQFGQRDAAVKGVQTFINLTLGKLVCVLDANNAAAVNDYFARIGFPVESVMHVEYEESAGAVFAMPAEQGEGGAAAQSADPEPSSDGEKK